MIKYRYKGGEYQSEGHLLNSIHGTLVRVFLTDHFRVTLVNVDGQWLAEDARPLTSKSCNGELMLILAAAIEEQLLNI